MRAEKNRMSIPNKIICLLTAMFFLCLSISAVFGSSVLDPDNYMMEHILFQKDNVLINLLSLILLFALILALSRLLMCFNPKILTLMLIIYVAIVGAIWVFAVKSVPSADSGIITDAASAFLDGNYASLRSVDSYFRYFPYQLGFTFICETLFRIFGSNSYIAVSLVNVMFLDIAYLALIKMSSLVFDNENVVRTTILLLAACLQPILFCTFIYGNIIGFALAMWAAVNVTVYLKFRRKRPLLFAVILIAAATLAKPNYYIFLVAMCIMLLLDCLKPFKPWNIITIVCAVALSVGLNKAVIRGYETASGADLGDGVPQILWAAMGLRESERAPGWFDGYTMTTFNESGHDFNKATEKAWENIDERLEYFISHLHYAVSFFGKKMLSQWNEPTYESIWISKTKDHMASVPNFVRIVYSGGLMSDWFNSFQQIIFLGSFLALISKNHDGIFAMIPLIVFGGFLYHIIFEAKSQYILIYFVMLMPYAAYGLNMAARFCRSKCSLKK